MGNKTKTKTDSNSEVAVADKTDLAEPKLFKVLLLNDDYTSMDFVVDVLETIFNKNPSEAVQIMMKIHKEGQGLCGIYAREIADTKVRQVHFMAEAHDYPLKAIMEEA